MVYKKDTDNSSQWETDPLLEIIERCAEMRGVDLNKKLKSKTRITRHGRNKWSPLRIATSKSRGDGYYTGRCYGVSSNPNSRSNIYLGLPSATKYEDWSGEETQQRQFDKERFAQVVLHEIDHSLGLRHSEMMDSKDLDTPDLSDITVRPKQEHRIKEKVKQYCGRRKLPIIPSPPATL